MAQWLHKPETSVGTNYAFLMFSLFCSLVDDEELKKPFQHQCSAARQGGRAQAPARGKPWVFRADAIDRNATVDLALLAKGYHIVTPPITTQAGAVQQHSGET